MKHGDFSTLADSYAKCRPDYAPSVVNTIVTLARDRCGSELRAADVGAGTGIFTRMLAQAGALCVAVEPCDEMRTAGEQDSYALDIEWRAGSAEQTALESNSYDLVSMASSFHWTDFDVATAEFARALRNRGLFVALWNPRYLEANPMLVEIESYLHNLLPSLERVSSGNSSFTDTLETRLRSSPHFKDVIYLEGKHTIGMSPERYIGVWESVNDIRVQAGEERFEQFLRYIDERTTDLESIEATYRTRAWVALK